MIRICLSTFFALLAAPVLAADAPYSREARGIVTVVPDDVRLPPCGSPRVFGEIAEAFEDKESEYWNSALTLDSFAAPVEIAYRPWGPEFIPRRFCAAKTTVSDGSVRAVFYSIGYKTGTLGVVPGVEWCVEGLDRNLAFAPNCKMARP